MKTKLVIMVLPFFWVLFFSACKKENTVDTNKLTSEQLEVVVDVSSTLTNEVHSFMNEAMLVAIDSGYNPNTPPSVSSAIVEQASLKSAKDMYTWTGPDFDGWYKRYWNSYGYTYSEKVRYRDTIDYEISYGYSGGEGSYSNTTTTQYIKYIKNGKVLYKGYSLWEIKASGYNNISATQWKITFEDFNTETRAGIYDWYWGVSENSGGNTVPTHRYEHLEATETQNNWLHVHVIWYDDDGHETWDFEYDTPYEPVDMPQLPDINQ